MKSYTTLRNLAGSLVNNTNSTTLTLLDQLINDGYRLILGNRDFSFLHKLRYLTTYAPTATITVVAGTDVGTATDNTVLTVTGTEVTFSTTGTLPAGLSANTTYYLIYQSATTFKVASSLANAIAGTAIDITDTGSGTHTMSVADRMQPLPYDIDQVESVYVTVSGTRHNPTPLPSRQKWDELNYNDQKSNIPIHWFTYEGKLGLWPRPSTDDQVITINGKLKVTDLNVADFTTGNIDFITNGSISVTGTGSSWTTPMAGRWIRVTHSNTAASSGDGLWYEIVSVPSSTTLTLARPYGGRSLTTGATGVYIIGQMPLLPETYHMMPVWYAVAEYWDMQGETARATQYRTKYELGLKELITNYSINDLSMVLDDGDRRELINPNLTVSL